MLFESRKVELIVLNELCYTVLNIGNWLLLPSSGLTAPITIMYTQVSVCNKHFYSISSMSQLSKYVEI